MATVPEEISLSQVERACGAHQLTVMGGLHDSADTVYLLGPAEPGFWQTFTQSSEYLDGEADALDRWSRRVISALADALTAQCIFPSDGPPFMPFVNWALESEQIWQSPISLLVHGQAGLWLSFRGALRFAGHHALPSTDPKPCDDCTAPCRTACPVGALTSWGYDVARCKAHLNGDDSASCMTLGCAARRSCPAGANYGRVPQQSAFHMKAFNPT